jgi:hypothetical protein
MYWASGDVKDIYERDGFDEEHPLNKVWDEFALQDDNEMAEFLSKYEKLYVNDELLMINVALLEEMEQTDNPPEIFPKEPGDIIKVYKYWEEGYDELKVLEESLEIDSSNDVDFEVGDIVCLVSLPGGIGTTHAMYNEKRKIWEYADGFLSTDPGPTHINQLNPIHKAIIKGMGIIEMDTDEWSVPGRLSNDNLALQRLWDEFRDKTQELVNELGKDDVTLHFLEQLGFEQTPE